MECIRSRTRLSFCEFHKTIDIEHRFFPTNLRSSLESRSSLHIPCRREMSLSINLNGESICLERKITRKLHIEAENATSSNGGSSEQFLMAPKPNLLLFIAWKDFIFHAAFFMQRGALIFLA